MAGRVSRTPGVVVDRDPVRAWTHFGITADAGGSDAGVGERSDGQLAFNLGKVGDVYLIVVVLFVVRTIGELADRRLYKCEVDVHLGW